MNKTDNTKLITVGNLLKELKRYGKGCSEYVVNIDIPDGSTLNITGMGLDKDGDLSIEVDEDPDEGYYDVRMLIDELEGYAKSTQVHLEGCGLYLTFMVNADGRIVSGDDDEEEIIGFDAYAFGEYEVQPAGVKDSEAEKRERPEKKRKKSCAIPWGFIALVLLAVAAMTAAFFLGLRNNIFAISIVAFVALIAIAVMVARIETCPYCGSIRLEKKKIDPNLNIANWSVRCKKCGEEFFME